MGLSILKAALVRRGIECRVLYANILFAEMVGVHPYDIVSRTNSNDLAGDWTFRAATFPEVPPVDEAYFEHIAEGLRAFEHLLRRAGGQGTMRDLVQRIEARAPNYVRTIANRIVDARPRIVGCGSTFQQHMASLALLRAVKHLRPDIITVMGGANCESEMGVATHRASPWVDYVVSGEADEAFPELCEQILSRGAQDEVTKLPEGVIGPCRRKLRNQPQEATPPRAVLTEMDRSPVPEFDDYFAALATSPCGERIEPGLPIETSRGCWWGALKHCTFCGLNGDGMGFRSKSPDRAISEFRDLVHRYQVERIYAVDNILVRDYFQTVLPALATRENRPHIFYETKANLQPDHLRVLAEANVRWIQPGLESFDDGILQRMAKGTTARQNVQLLKGAREFGINVYWLFLYDIPGESDQRYLEMAELLPKLAHLQPPRALSYVQYVRFSPYHQSPKAHGISLEVDRSYRWVYPWDEAVLDDFAYYFDDYTADRERIEMHHERPLRRPGFQALKDAFRHWNDQWPHAGLDGGETMAMLYMVDDGDALTVTDTRRCRREAMQVLTGLPRAVSLICHDAVTETTLRNRLATDFGIDANPEELDAAVAQLIDGNLLVALGSHLVGLPLEGRPSPLPSWVHQPGGRIVSLREHAIRRSIPALLRLSALAGSALMHADAPVCAAQVASLAGLLANCWLDSDVRERLTSDPKTTLAAHGIAIPPDVDVEVLTDAPDLRHLVFGTTPLDESARVEVAHLNAPFLDMYAYLYERACGDDDLRQALLQCPTQTVRQLGFRPSDRLTLRSCESSRGLRYLAIPPAPDPSLFPVARDEIAMLTSGAVAGSP